MSNRSVQYYTVIDDDAVIPDDGGDMVSRFEFELKEKRIAELERQNEHMKTALTDIWKQPESESWSYEQLQFVAKATLETLEDVQWERVVNHDR